MAFKVLGGKFNFGVDIDDMWRYAGLPDPPSVVIPYLLSKRTYNGRFSLPAGDGKIDDRKPRDFTGSLIQDGNKHDTKRLARMVAAFLKRSKIDYVRCWFPWNFFQPRVGDGYKFPLDDFVNEMDDAGIGIIAVVGDGYGRFIPKNASTSNLKAYLGQLTDSSTEIVRHYGGKISAWQIENEVNGWTGHTIANWRSGWIWLDEKNKEPVLKALSGAVREESPKSKIVINLGYIGSRRKWKMYAKYCDIIGVDPYPSYYAPNDTSASGMGKLADVAAEETGLPVYIVETGYPAGPHIFGFDEQKQAKYVASACIHALESDKIHGLGMYRFSDSYWKSFPPMENAFGLLTVQGKPKPAWYQYAKSISEAGH